MKLRSHAGGIACVHERGRVRCDTRFTSRWLTFLFGGFHLARVWHFVAMCGFLTASGRKLQGSRSEDSMR